MDVMPIEEGKALSDLEDPEFNRIQLSARQIPMNDPQALNAVAGYIHWAYALGRKRGRADTAVTFIVKDQE